MYVCMTDIENVILNFLEDGPKGRDDFWECNDFYDPDKERGVYPRNALFKLKHEGLVEKFKGDDRRVRWRLIEETEEEEKPGLIGRIFGG